MIYLISNQTQIPGEFNHSTIQECYNYLKDKQVISLDIETTRKYNKYFEIEGLDPHTSDIVMLQVGDDENQFIIDIRNTDLGIVKDVLTNPDIVKVGHNLKFEYKHILHKYKIRINNLYDTMIVEQILYNGLQLKNSLEVLNLRYLDIKVEKAIRLEFLSIGSTPFTSSQIKYGAEDIEFPVRIREKQLIEIQRRDLMQCVKLEMRFLVALAEIEYNGVNFNKEKWKATYDENLIEFNSLIKDLNAFIITNYSNSRFINRQLDLFSEEPKCNIQWTSSKQVIDFFKFLGICPLAVSKTTGKLSYTVEAKEVRPLLIKEELDSLTREFVRLYLRAKESEQTITTFGVSFFKHINPITGRLHSNYKQILNTGRISSAGPNLQNIPARHEFRYAFDAPSNKSLINADYSGQEKIILANKSLDKDLLVFFDKNLGDLHSYTAKLVYKTELADIALEDVKHIRKDLRQKVKASGFAIDYGGNGFTIAANLGITTAEGDAVYNAYFNAFPGLKAYFQSERDKSLRQGYILIDKLTKRKFYFKDYDRLKEAEWNHDYKLVNKLQGQMGRAAQNYSIQGEAGSITKYAVVLLHEWITSENLLDKIKIVLLVHDEIVLESDEELKDYAKTKLQELMETAGALWCKRVPLKAEAVISNLWEH